MSGLIAIGNPMIDRIEVYIRNEEVATNQAIIIGHPISDGLTTHYCTAKETLKTERVMSEADRLALEVVQKFAGQNGLRVEVCDVSTFRGQLRARLRGIRKTPAVVVGGNRIEVQNIETLADRLKSFLEE